MILDLDTDVLRSSVSVAERANDEITNAMNMLNQIIVHDDWICPDRELLKNKTLENRTLIQNLQNDSTAFYKAIESSSARFDETEQTCIQRTNQVDALIAQIKNVVPGLAGSVSIGNDIAITKFNDDQEAGI